MNEGTFGDQVDYFFRSAKKYALKILLQLPARKGTCQNKKFFQF